MFNTRKGWSRRVLSTSLATGLAAGVMLAAAPTANAADNVYVARADGCSITATFINHNHLPGQFDQRFVTLDRGAEGEIKSIFAFSNPNDPPESNPAVFVLQESGTYTAQFSTTLGGTPEGFAEPVVVDCSVPEPPAPPAPVYKPKASIWVKSSGRGEATLNNTLSTGAYSFRVRVNGHDTKHVVPAGDAEKVVVNGAKRHSIVKVLSSNGRVVLAWTRA